MITLDSPVTTVLGAQTKRGLAKKLTEGLGLRTVGDLLHHFPRRYIRTGELTKVKDLAPGQMLTVVGEIVESEVNSYRDRRSNRPAYRLDTMLQTDGPALRMTFFSQKKHISDWHAERLAVGRRGIFIGQVGTYRGKWQLTNPTMVLFGVSDEAVDADGRCRGRLDQGALPALPADQGRRLVGPAARHRVRADGGRRAGGPPARRRTPRVPPARRRDRAGARPCARLVARAAGGPASLPLRRGAGDPARDGAPPGGPGRAGRPGTCAAAGASSRRSTPGCRSP